MIRLVDLFVDCVVWFCLLCLFTFYFGWLYIDLLSLVLLGLAGCFLLGLVLLLSFAGLVCICLLNCFNWFVVIGLI